MHRMNRLSTGVLLAAVACAPLVAQAQGKPIVYPAKGQSAEKQQTDDGECYVWAKGNTGIDPAALAAAPPPAPPASADKGPNGTVVKGAVRGAVVGEVFNDDAGKGAAIGATGGVIRGGAARQKQAAAQEAKQASADAQKKSALGTYYRAYGACMEGRGYTIK